MTPIQPHKADPGAARTSPGRSQNSMHQHKDSYRTSQQACGFFQRPTAQRSQRWGSCCCPPAIAESQLRNNAEHRQRAGLGAGARRDGGRPRVRRAAGAGRGPPDPAGSPPGDAPALLLLRPQLRASAEQCPWRDVLRWGDDGLQAALVCTRFKRVVRRCLEAGLYRIRLVLTSSRNSKVVEVDPVEGRCPSRDAGRLIAAVGRVLRHKV